MSFNTEEFLSIVRQHCEGVGFDWPSNNTQQSGPPERVTYQDEACIRDAVWERAELFKLLIAEQDRAAELAVASRALLDLLLATDGEAEDTDSLAFALVKKARAALSEILSPVEQDRRAALEPLLKRLSTLDSTEVEVFLTLPRKELEQRALIQKDWIGHYACSLDGLGLESHKDTARLPNDIRNDVCKLLTQIDKRERPMA